jgi:hypothetical protein
MLIGACTLTVPVFVAVTVTVAELPPFFRIAIDEGLAVSVQPMPLPLMGGPAVPPPLPLQSTVLLWTPLPVTTAVDSTSDVPLTVA